MGVESCAYYMCGCEVLPSARITRKPERKEPSRRNDDSQSDTRVLNSCDGYTERYIGMRSISSTKCASCTAAAAASARRAMRPGYESWDNQEDDLGFEASTEALDDVAAYNSPPMTAETANTPQSERIEGNGREWMEETHSEAYDEDYNSDDTISPHYVYPVSSEADPNEDESPNPSQDSNSEAINHDDRRMRPSPPAPNGRRHSDITPSSSSSGSQSSSEGDEETEEASFRRRADRKYLRVLGRKDGWA